MRRPHGRIFVDLDFGQPPPRCFIRLSGGSFTVTGAIPMSVIIPSGKSVVATLQLFDVNNNPTEFDSPPEWITTDPAIISIEGSEQYSRRLRAVGPLGSVQVSVRGDADLGDGVRELVVLDDAVVVAGDAVRGSLGYGAIED